MLAALLFVYIIASAVTAILAERVFFVNSGGSGKGLLAFLAAFLSGIVFSSVIASSL